MNPEHLTAASFRALLRGEIDPLQRDAFLAHLQEPCDLCEQALATEAQSLEPDTLDGLADTILLSLREAGWPADAVAGERLMRRLGQRRRTIGLAAGVMAMAASVALFLSFGPGLDGDAGQPGQAPPPEQRLEQGLKGGSDTPGPRLEFAHLDKMGTLSPVTARDLLPRSGHLLLRFDSPVALCGDLLLRSGAQTLLEASGTCLARGLSTYQDDGEVVAVDLSDPDLGDSIEVLFTTREGSWNRLEVRLSPAG